MWGEVEGEGALHPEASGHAADSEAGGGALAAHPSNHHAQEGLRAGALTLADLVVDLYRVPGSELRDVWVLVDLYEMMGVHAGPSSYVKIGATNQWYTKGGAMGNGGYVSSATAAAARSLSKVLMDVAPLLWLTAKWHRSLAVKEGYCPMRSLALKISSACSGQTSTLNECTRSSESSKRLELPRAT